MNPMETAEDQFSAFHFRWVAWLAMALQAGAGSLTLTAGEALAAGPAFCPGVAPDTATVSTISGSVTATCLAIPGNPSPAPDTVPNWFATNNLGSQPIAAGRQDDVVIDFNDGMTGTDMPGLPGGFTGYFYYTITSLGDPYVSTIFDLNADIASITATQKVWYTDPGPDPLSPIIPADLTLAWTGSTVTAPITPATTTVWVLNTYDLVSTAPALDNVKNRFSTPGPLPVLATGVAFGFSRKLHARPRTSRLA
ncbi:MAG: hypothetical protein ACK6AD_10725 [Cyanobacteriota bacterium]|jgi:hypothetical protein